MLSKKSKVTLQEISEKTVHEICKLSVLENQKKFVASNAFSIAQAYFSKKAWFRAIYADEIPVGFIMIEDDPEKPEYYLWRFMIDAQYQRLGFGCCAILLLIEHVKKRPGATEILASVVQSDGGPQSFYEKLGFKLTGEYENEEAIMKLIIK